jgi:hypothetical protein
MTLRKPESYVCRVCGRTLDVHTGTFGEQRYHHTGAVQKIDQVEHEADPVLLSEAETAKPLCDVCLAEDPDWVLPVTDHPLAFQSSDKDAPLHMDVNGWALCEDCAVSVRLGNLDDLATRAQEGNAMRADTIGPWWVFRAMMEDLSHNISGPPRPLEKRGA